MSFLSDLIARGKDMLSLEPKPPTETEAIKRNDFDRQDWDKAKTLIPGVQATTDTLKQSVDYVDDFMADLHAAFYRIDPTVRSPLEMKPTHVPNRSVIESLLALPKVQELRQHSAGDVYGSAMAMGAMAEVVTETLTRAQSAADEAAKAAQEAQEAREARAGEIAQMLAQAEANGDPTGTQTEALKAKLDQFDQLPPPDPNATQQAAMACCAGQQNKLNLAAMKATDDLDNEAELMAAFGVEPGEVKSMDARERMALATNLRGNRLAKFAKLLGQFRKVQQAEERKRVTDTASEVHGIKRSNDLMRMTTSEYMNFADPTLELLMKLRWATHQLNTYDVRGKERQGQGPIIAVVDESGSMSATDVAGGSREAWSKALALALCEQARKRNRTFTYIGFSSAGQQRVIRFPDGKAPLEKVLDMTEGFLNGGTNFEKPLLLALKEIESLGDQPKPDIVMITDDAYGPMDPKFMHQWNKAKDKLSLKCYGIALGCQVGIALEAVSDNVRAITELVESDPRKLGDIFRTV